MSMQNSFIPCIECGKKAVWSYVPGFENYCDDCVPRGRSCNSELKDDVDYDSPEASDPKSYVERLDDRGRRYPCCEYFDILPELHNDIEYIKMC
jgi:hypothetical protein